MRLIRRKIWSEGERGEENNRMENEGGKAG